MSANYLQCLNQIASYLKTPSGKLTLEESVIPVCTRNDKTVKGFYNIINAYAAGDRSKLIGTSREDKAEIHQWIEYVMVYATQTTTNQMVQQILSELNSVFTLKTYLVSHRLSIADVLLYYVLLNVVQNLSYLEKEKYVHVARWFDNMQQDSSVRQKNKLVDFSTNYLIAVAPARH